MYIVPILHSKQPFNHFFFQMNSSSSLFVNIIDLDKVNGHIICSLRTAIVLYVCQYVNAPVILVVSKNTEENHNTFKFSINDLCYETILEHELPRPAADCLLPVFQSDNGYYCTAGFCSSLRMVCVYM